MQKRSFWHMHPTETQINSRICTVWAESSLSVWKLQCSYEETQTNRVSDFRNCVCSLFQKAMLFWLLFVSSAIYNASCEYFDQNRSNGVSDFRDFVCSLFPKANLFDFYLYPRLSTMRPVTILIAQSDLNIHWAHMSKGTFSDVAAK